MRINMSTSLEIILLPFLGSQFSLLESLKIVLFRRKKNKATKEHIYAKPDGMQLSNMVLPSHSLSSQWHLILLDPEV